MAFASDIPDHALVGVGEEEGEGEDVFFLGE